MPNVEVIGVCRFVNVDPIWVEEPSCCERESIFYLSFKLLQQKRKTKYNPI